MYGDQSGELVCGYLGLKALIKRHAGVGLGRDECRGVLIQAGVASVSVWFRSKERPKNGIFCFGRARNGKRAKIFPTLPTPSKFPFNPLPALSLAPFFTRFLTLVSLSLLRACYAGYGNISAKNWSKYESFRFEDEESEI